MCHSNRDINYQTQNSYLPCDRVNMLMYFFSNFIKLKQRQNYKDLQFATYFQFQLIFKRYWYHTHKHTHIHMCTHIRKERWGKIIIFISIWFFFILGILLILFRDREIQLNFAKPTITGNKFGVMHYGYFLKYPGNLLTYKIHLIYRFIGRNYFLTSISYQTLSWTFK